MLIKERTIRIHEAPAGKKFVNADGQTEYIKQVIDVHYSKYLKSYIRGVRKVAVVEYPDGAVQEYSYWYDAERTHLLAYPRYSAVKLTELAQIEKEKIDHARN